MNSTMFYEPHKDPLKPIDLSALLEAISAVESGHDNNAVGRRGERGRYQIRAATWSSYGRGRFEIGAHDPVAATECATRYLRSLARLLLDHKHPVNVTELATLWNTGTLLTGHNAYAERVTNLYYDACKSQTSHSSPPSLPTGSPR